MKAFRKERRIVSVARLLASLLVIGNINAFSAPTFSLNLDTVFNSFGRKAKSFEFKYTHLEVNGMLCEIPEADVSIVIDPIASQLDFGIPWGYRANKKFLDEVQTLDLIEKAQPDVLLLSMGLDDHTHLPTLKKIVERLPDLRFIVAPSAEKKVASIVPDSQLTVLKPGTSISIGKSSTSVTIRATEGALVGPPWQARENGWLFDIGTSLKIYYEPHADVQLGSLANIQADIIISPVKEQSLPAQMPKAGQFTLVYGGQRTLEIAECLGSSVVIPLGNGDLTTEGPLAELVSAAGSLEEFEEMVEKRNKTKDASERIRVERATPGVPLKVRL